MTMKSNLWVWMSAALLAAVTGCGKKETKSTAAAVNAPLPEPPMVAQCDPGIPGGRLVVSTFGDPKTFNPITENESSSQDIIRFLFASLLTYDWQAQDVGPGLAEKWAVAPDQKTWTFTLRKNLRWSDGEPLTADDVVFTWDVIYDTNIVNVTADLFTIEGKKFEVTKVDDLTVKVVTPFIYAPFLENFGAGVPIIPKHILEQAVKARNFESSYGINTAPDQLVGSGPYKLKGYRPGEYTDLVRNPYFFEVDSKGQRLPYIDEVIYTVVPDMNAISLRFLKGESDVHELIMPDQYQHYKDLADQGKFHLLDLGIGLEKSFLWFNQNTNVNSKTGAPYVDPVKLKWFRNTRFRQAIAYSLDRQSIINSVYAGRAKPEAGFVTEANKKWLNTNLPAYPHDLEKARAILAGIGIKDRNQDGILEDEDDHPIEFVMNTNTGNNIRDKIAVLVQEDLKQLGVKLIYQPIEFNTLVDKINNTYDYDCILLGLAGGGADPSASMNVLKSDGFTHQWFPREKQPSTDWEAEIDKLMNAQLTTLDYQERKKYFDKVQLILAEQVPMIYTVSPFNYAAARSDLANLRPTALSYYRLTWNVEELYFKK